MLLLFWGVIGLESENPYHHLLDFERLCSLFAIAGMTQDTLKWKLFPFSLIGKAEQWYTYTVGSVHDNWEELRDKFCLEFFPMSRIIALHRDIRSFQQNERESIRAAWYRFLSLIESGLYYRYPNPCCFATFMRASTSTPPFVSTLSLEDHFPV